jgi:hypothetical protein
VGEVARHCRGVCASGKPPGAGSNVQINFLSHTTLDKLYVMIFPDGSMVVPKGSDYLDYGPFLAVTDIDEVLSASEFDSAKHLRHSRSWKKAEPPALLAVSAGG